MKPVFLLCVSLLPVLINALARSRVLIPLPIATDRIEVHSHEHVPRPNILRAGPNPMPLNSGPVDGRSIPHNTTSATTTAAVKARELLVASTKVQSTVLILARDTLSAYSASSGLNGYGIPFEVVVVPQTGITLPVLNSSSSAGNYGAIVVVSEVSYNYGGTLGFQSAITAAQWAQIYQYQVSFGVRAVRLDVFPSTDLGVTAIGGCCNDGVEQLIQISDTSAFPTSGLKVGAGVSTQGLWHYPATILNATIATPFATFGPSAGFPASSVAGVINNINDRQQMVFFIGFATEWSSTSNYLQHAWIHWATRGLYAGYRRINLNTQVDDMFLESDIYYPAINRTFIITPTDLDQHIAWMDSVNSRLPAGSNYFIEVGHNGNGNIETADDINANERICRPGPIEYGDQIDTALEFQKPLGTGTDIWPTTATTYPYNVTCTAGDLLMNWWSQPSNMNAYAHVSHTFTHEDENNATFADVNREISWNQAWLTQVGIASATKWSPKGLIPPAITGLHNGDALRAWQTNGIVQVVGDNTRPALMNTQNEFWPLITTVADNGFAGIQISPRWATNIYYNCDLPICTVQEWINTSAGNGDWYALLDLEQATNTRHLLGLHRDPFMFHQANLNYVTADLTTINGVTAKLSMLQAWVEVVTQEMVRLTNWPIISLKHDDFSVEFSNRMTRDQCVPSLVYSVDPAAKTITDVTVTANGNTCGAEIPVTVPGPVTDTQGFRTEQVGSDPLTIWVTLTGGAVLTSFTFIAPIPL
ncbi:hypothetical protein BJ878DRAFT_511884 [Calycina marina]|uniref:Extracellular serine-rich protein n=1 Tax=Calycina marina TaxID=1763456 RepID=A0A9P7Z0V1_9HELO|nr:hypothetical protein BJ878DRAFT_511884 [Calycina marina]